MEYQIHAIGKAIRPDLVTNAGNQASNQIDLLLLGFSKAFNKVSRHCLLYKLSHYDIREPLHNWISDIYKADINKYYWKAVLRSGVPQDPVLGLFIFFYASMTFLPNYLPQSDCALTM